MGDARRIARTRFAGGASESGRERRFAGGVSDWITRPRCSRSLEATGSDNSQRLTAVNSRAARWECRDDDRVEIQLNAVTPTHRFKKREPQADEQGS